MEWFPAVWVLAVAGAKYWFTCEDPEVEEEMI